MAKPHHLLLALAPLLAAAAPQGLDPARLDRFTPLIQQKLQEKKLAGAVVMVMRDGHVAYQKSFGQADIATGRPMTPDTIFRIFSMTKPIVAVAALQLYEQGKFDLRDPISNWLPEFAHMQVATITTDAAGHKTTTLAPAKHPITVLDLMRHTSGLGYYYTQDETGAPYYRKYGIAAIGGASNLEAWTKQIAKAPLIAQPGTLFYYSFSIDVLGRLVEIWSGKTLDVALNDAIFQKLGMKDTGFYVPPEKLNRLATLYTPSTPGITDDEGITGLGGPIIPYPGGPGPQDAFKQKPALFSGGGGLVSTATDYARFVSMLAAGGTLDGVRLLSPKTVDLMRADVLGAIPRGPGGPWDGYGFGLTVEVSLGQGPSATLSTQGEYDWAGAASTQFFIDPKEHLCAVMMLQVLPSAPYWGRMLRQISEQAIVSSEVK